MKFQKPLYCYKLYEYRTKNSLYIKRNWAGGYSLGTYRLVEPESCVFPDDEHNAIVLRCKPYTDNGWILIRRPITDFFDVWSLHNRHAWYR